MKKFSALLLLCLLPAGLWAGFSLGRPAAVKKRVAALDDKVLAAQDTPPPSPPPGPSGPNQAPAISAFTAVSTTVAAGGVSTIFVSSSDPDGDTLTSVWTSTVGTFGGSGASRYWLAPSTPGVYAITCTVSDASLSVSSSVLVKAVTPGTKAWTFTAAGAINSAAVAGSFGTVYVVDTVDKLYAIDQYGAQKWAFSTENHDAFNYQPFVTSDGTAYVVAADTKVYAVAADGSIKWGPSAPSANKIDAPPVMGPDGRVYVYDKTASAVYSLDPATGVSVSTFAELGGILRPPVSGPGNVVYIVANDGTDDILYAVPAAGIDSSTQTIVTGISTDETWYGISAGKDGSVYWDDGSGSVSAIKPDGSDKWGGAVTYTPGLADRGPVLGLDGNLYVIDSGAGITRLSSATGSAFSFTTSFTPPFTAPAIAGPDGVTYGVFGTDLYAASPSDDAKWGPYSVTAPATAIFTSAPPAFGAAGMVYIVDDAPAGRVTALYATSALP